MLKYINLSCNVKWLNLYKDDNLNELNTSSKKLKIFLSNAFIFTIIIIFMGFQTKSFVSLNYKKKKEKIIVTAIRMKYISLKARDNIKNIFDRNK